MEIHSIQSYKGRNIYSHKPVVKIIFDIGELEGIETKDMGDFNRRLLNLLPGLSKHFCCKGYEGGFIERLREGTFIGHVTEHVIIELQHLAGYEICFGRTRLLREPSTYYMVYAYGTENCGMECGKAGFGIISDLLSGKQPNIGNILNYLIRVKIESELGPTTKAIFDEAKRRGIPVTRLGAESLLQLGYGKYQRRIEASLTDATSCISADIAGNKHLTKQLLSAHNIPVPFGELAFSVESAVKAASAIGYPVVVKPFDANQGKGVTINITGEKQLLNACGEAFKHSRAVLVERFIGGKDYRVLVVGGRVSAVAERRPPAVAGDGIHTLRELVDIENSSPLRGIDHERPLTRIIIDELAKQVLCRKNIDETYIPAPGETVYLRENGNLSTGGTARDCTAEIHPQNAEMAVKAAGIAGLDIAGIDITADDISKPVNLSNGAIIEINAAPGLRMHLFPSEGRKRDVTGDIMDMLYPEGRPFTIPVVSITGTNGKTTTTRLVTYVLSIMNLTVGMTCTSGVFIGNQCILKGDNTGPVSAGIILSGREIDAAVLETARGGIVKRGLGYDLADVGVITNISEDHLGLDGINSLEELAFVKSLVIEAVKPDGYSVLNADDPLTPYCMKRASGNIILFSRSGKGELLEKHMEAGGLSVYAESGSIIVYNGRKAEKLVEIDEIPITLGGMADCNVENSLAATAALVGLKVPLKVIKPGLKSFKPDTDSNPGRFNIFEMGDFRVMLDYGHNTAGYKEIAKLTSKMGADRVIGVIGMPGDRMDISIAEVGKICCKAFSRIYIKEDRDLRGRRPGEVAGLLYDTIKAEGYEKENISVINREEKALEAAILDARPGDLIVMLYEEFEPAAELVRKYQTGLLQTMLQSRAPVGEKVV